MPFRPTRIALVAGVLLALALAAVAGVEAATLPQPIASAVHGRVLGWAKAPDGYAALYVTGRGRGWCGLDGTIWWVGFVRATDAADRLTSTHRVGAAMCGNSVSWMRAGRFSDGRHEEIAFQLWQTPSIGATTYLYRVEGGRLVKLATFPGDRVTVGPGTVTARFENAGRSPSGKATMAWRFSGGRYRLAA